MGLAPGESRLGDEVGIVHGCGVSFIIRPVESRKIDGENSKRKIYVLVGECYVHGYMGGEATRDDKANKLQPLIDSCMPFPRSFRITHISR